LKNWSIKELINNILQIEIYDKGVESFKNELRKLLDQKSSVAIHLCNAYTLALAYRVPELHKVLKKSTFNVPDGKPLSKLINLRKNIQIRGLNLVQEILSDSHFKNYNHLFFGSDLEGSLMLKKHLEDHFHLGEKLSCLPAPYLEVDDFDIDALIEYCRINEIKFVWLGLGTPKQDFLVSKIVESTRYPLIVVPVGAVFDFLIGRKSKSPEILSKIGLEWAFRLVSEPKRLSKRYLVYNLIFIFVVVKSIAHRIMDNVK
jgi:N-acetylglucosaminyldiphosphoundecaprenol N-acetyl-beta-D-mannosaminyltransferase